MLIKSFLIKISYVFLMIALAMFIAKLVWYSRYRSVNGEIIPWHLAWYRKVEIYSTSSAPKRRFMQQMNLFTSIIFISILVYVISFLFRKLVV